MTTISPKDVVEQFMARIGAGDIDGAIEMHADDIVIDFSFNNILRQTSKV